MVLKVLNNLVPVLEERIGKIEDSPPNQDPNAEQKKFLKNKGQLKFSDSVDKDIFVEFIYTSLQEELKEFFSNDWICIKQARRAIKELTMDQVTFEHIKPLKKKPYYELN